MIAIRDPINTMLSSLLPSLLVLVLVHPFHTALSRTPGSDSISFQAESFGWLAIRNLTHCLSPSSDSLISDPPNKPRGIQPPTAKTSNSDGSTRKRLTGMGDSVVVLYHPEMTNKALAWCNTLVAFESMDHVKCHMAVPTCQRCDAVRSKKPGGGTAIKGKKEKAPNKKLGDQPPASGRAAVDIGNIVQLHKRANEQPYSNDHSDTDQPRLGSPRPFGSSTFQHPSSDPELEEATAEFQDFCENKLTLAVRADCPLHLVQGWQDEPPFDLMRFCMKFKGSDGYTLHENTEPKQDQEQGGEANGDDAAKEGGADQSKGKKAAFDPNDPVVPPPEGVAEGVNTYPAAHAAGQK